MNNFEKRKFLDYLEKLLPVTDTNSYSFDTVFDFFITEFKIDPKIFTNVDEDGNLHLESKKARVNFAREFRKVVKKLKQDILPKETRLEQQFINVKNLFLLNENEYEVLLYFSLKEINNIFDRYFDSLNNQSFNTFIKHYLSLRMGQKERLLESMWQKNITKGRVNEHINARFLKIFDSPKCNTTAKIIDVLIGEKQKTI